ncbi:hypothetical protein J7J55_02490 [Candidatus Bipolaricaulota bacterium]|nr:hypothetical protein [Candidatus Bipolaricaulota bacterium]
MNEQPATKDDLKQFEERLSAEIRANASKIDANAKKIDTIVERLDANSRKIESNAEKIEANGRAIRQLTHEVVEIKARLDQTITRDEFKAYFDEIITGQDEMMKILVQLNQERTATNTRLDRVEADVEKNKRDIKKIKSKLAMP